MLNKASYILSSRDSNVSIRAFGPRGLAMEVRKAGAARTRSTLLICFLIGLATAVAQAGRGSISGLDNGALVPDAKVVPQRRATGVKLDAVSAIQGLYSFVCLTLGNDQITVMFFSTWGFEPLAIAVIYRTTFKCSY